MSETVPMSSHFASLMAELERKAQDPEWQAAEAKRRDERERQSQASAQRYRVSLLERLGAPLRVGMPAIIAAIPRHLDPSECQCSRDVNNAKCVVPPGYQDFKAVDLVRRWMDARRKQPAAWKPILVMLSQPGVGKTAASSWAAMRHNGDYTKTRTLTAAHRAMFGDQAEHWQRLMRSPLLVIDDLGREADEHGVVAVEDAIDERQGRPTIITANMTKAQVLARYGTRVESRLAESGVIVWIDDDDHRRAP